MILHEIYFDGLGGASKPAGALADAIARDFGMERWRAKFAAMGKAEGGGSGWVILAYSPRNKRLVPVGCRSYDDARGMPSGLGARYV